MKYGSNTLNREIKDIKDKIFFIRRMNNYKLRTNAYNYWDLYVLVKIFSAISDTYKVDSITSKQRKEYIRILYSLAKKHKLRLRYFAITDCISRASLVKLKLAHLALNIKYRGR